MPSKRTFQWLPLALLMSSAPVNARSQFTDTVGSTVEQAGGISDSELNAETQKIITRFRNGRKSSAEGMASRYAGILEMHDENYDGITDHAHTGDALEGGTDEAAIGKRGMTDPQRETALLKAKQNAGRCKNGLIGANACSNVSANLVDRGAAHGHDPKTDEGEEHRVLELTKAATDKAKQAGQDYGNRAAAEATDWGNIPNSQGVQAVPATDGYVRQVKVTRDGKTQTVNVGAQIDMLKSEAMWLEDQKKRQIDLEWQAIRAARLAGADKYDKEAIAEFTGILGQKNKTPQQIQTEISQRIVTRSGFYEKQVCPNGKRPSYEGNQIKCDNQIENPKNLKPLGLLTSSADPTTKETANKTYAAFIKEGEKALTDDQKKKYQSQLKDVQKCMERDVWCMSSQKAESLAKDQNDSAVKEKYKAMANKPVKGDPGNAFDDVREAIYNRLSVANDGPLDRFEATMKTIDFSKATDAKTETKPYAEMMKEVQAAKQAVIDTRKSQQQAAAQAQANGLKFQSNYNGAMFDPSKQSERQLFGRNLQRDGSTLSNGGSAPAQAPQQGPQSNSLRTPANYQAYPGLTQPPRK